jgi:hypothetical protein
LMLSGSSLQRQGRKKADSRPLSSKNRICDFHRIRLKRSITLSFWSPVMTMFHRQSLPFFCRSFVPFGLSV